MRRVGIGSVAILVVLGIIFGSVAGAIVGAVAAVVTRPSNTVQYIGSSNQSNSNLTTADRITVPVTNAVGVVKKVGPAVVEIVHQIPAQYDSFGNQTQPGGTAIGSGFIIDTAGDIVTNNHVVSGATSYQVFFSNGRRTTATLVGANPSNDIAVIKVNVPVPAVAHFANSALLEPGQPVVAIGDALGVFQNTVTAGIVSGLHRDLPAGSGVSSQDMIQTDAAINHGNSGGPLVDMAGDVVGIDTAIERSTNTTSSQQCSALDIFCSQSTDPNATVAEGLGFAIPANTAAPLAEHIIHHVPPAYLGACYHAVTGAAEYYGIPAGARISTGCQIGQPAIAPGSPAAQAGLRANDVIVALGGIKLSNSVSLEQVVVVHNPGDVVTIQVWRPTSADSNHGKIVTLKATLGTSTLQVQ